MLRSGEMTGIAQIVRDPEGHPGLAAEYLSLVWDERGLAAGRREEHAGCTNDECDAMLYAWRHCYAYTSVVKEKGPEFGTDAYFDRQEKERLAYKIEKMKDDKYAEEHGLGENPWAMGSDGFPQGFFDD